VVSKHGKREMNRARDYVHKLTTHLTRAFPVALHGFENLEKQGMYSKSRKHNRDIAKQNWKQIIQYMDYKTKIKLVNPYKTSSICPLCGGEVMKLQGGRVVRCRNCGLTLDRQLCGAINIYLKMCGFPPSPSTFYRLVSRPLMRLMKRREGAFMRTLGGVATNGDEGYDKPLMNSRGGLSLMNPKAYIGLPIPM
jgi:putative transposase